ncbi:MAG: RNA polymerase sigma factor SigF [Mycobacteriales bacterium]
MLTALAELDSGGPPWVAAREELVRMHLPLVEYLARRFCGRGEPLDDPVQVGTVGLINAVDRFDVTHEVQFATFATPTIVGEIKRHFRDRGWMIRVPRRLQELRSALGSATEELTHALGRSPTVRELAARLAVGEDEVLEGLDSARAYTTASLDAGLGDAANPIVDSLGADDPGLDRVEAREAVRPLLRQLPDREKRLLSLRYFQGKTQSEIATELGISQMHVSRLLTRTLQTLREARRAP